MKEPRFLYAPKSFSLTELIKHIKNALNYFLMTVKKVKDILIKDLRVWKLKDSTEEALEEYDRKHWNYTSAKIDATLLVK